MILRQQILTLLKQCGSYQLPDGTLRDSLRQVMGDAVTDAEIEASLKWLKDKALIDYTVEEVTETKRWAITEAGKAKTR